MKLEINTVKIETPKGVNVIIGTSHFIKTVEDIYETMMNSVPQIKFGLGFCEGSGDLLVRVDGTDEELKRCAAENALKMGCGHSFIVLLKDTYPINVLNALKNVPEVCTIFAASANPLEVIVFESSQGRGILGVVDGQKPVGIEGKTDMEQRERLLRRFGYKK